MEWARIKEGMVVFSADGERLGKVVRREPDGFLVEKGHLFHRDYLCRYADVAAFSDTDVFLRRHTEQLVEVPRHLWQPLP